MFVFQIYTANRNVLESQTATRVIQMQGVLPKKIYDVVNDETLDGKKLSDARHYVRQRTQKYNRTTAVVQRVEQIKQHAKANKRQLTIVFMDEAHYSATR